MPDEHLTADPLDRTVMLYHEVMDCYLEMTDQSGHTLNQLHRQQISTMCDTLLGHMLQHFDAHTCTQADVQQLWQRRGLEEQGARRMTTQDLQQVPAGCVPVLIMRNLIGLHRVPLLWHTMAHSGQFTQLYRDKLPGL